MAAASVSTAASAATIYKDDTSTLNMGGRVEVRANFSDANKDQNANDNTYKDASRVRLNIEGIQKYNDDLSFYGFTEYELSDKATGVMILISTLVTYSQVSKLLMATFTMVTKIPHLLT